MLSQPCTASQQEEKSATWLDEYEAEMAEFRK